MWMARGKISVLPVAGSGVARVGCRVIAALLVAAFVLATTMPPPARAAESGGALDPAPILQSLVRLRALVPFYARTAGTLGTDRLGSGVVIDGEGLIVTSGALLTEANRIEVETADGGIHPAEIVGYDPTSGLGVVRGMGGFKAPPLRLGHPSNLTLGDRLLVAIPVGAGSGGGAGGVRGTVLAARRAYAGDWEYLLEGALYTAPPVPAVVGAALIDRHGALVGIGAQAVDDALPGSGVAGSLFIPIDLLEPVLGDLLIYGHSQEPPRPWLGVYSREAEHGRVSIDDVVRGGPAEAAGVRGGDLVLGVAGEPVKGLADFYRKVWALGPAGVGVPLDVLRGTRIDTVTVASIARQRHFRSRHSY